MQEAKYSSTGLLHNAYHEVQLNLHAPLEMRCAPLEMTPQASGDTWVVCIVGCVMAA